MPTLDVLDSTMFYREEGTGVPLVFLHGNPTSSYLWRNVMPRVGGATRRIAPDLIGMGESGKPPLQYTYGDHVRYLDAWFDAMGLGEVVLVGHDWGGALAFDWASRHEDRVRGIAFLEAVVRPMTWEDFPASGRQAFEALRTPGVGEQQVMESDAFVEQLLPQRFPGIDPQHIAVYQAPYKTPESRRPLLEWPRAMPIEGQPPDVVARIEAYDRWLAASGHVPKLVVAFQPGPGIIINRLTLEWCKQSIAALEVAEAGTAIHHAPESRPEAIGDAIDAWGKRHGLW
jgi:haloalkane dehalogenase